ncbi:activating signal cointegrator 1 complex subunit 2-like isoform X2 [Halichondria panicea]|uniref:activating signal cointegrator 1 complex subunit 2-like isoform X2 n=1 Tax=Halichondria panicea TaxID=6063 RepID=UPI00312B8CF4
MAACPLESIITERLNPQSGLIEKLPLLDSTSCTDVSFLPYRAPRHGIEPDLLWLEAIQELDSDLHWLLKLPHPNFWSQVVYDSSLQKCLDSYLRNAPRSYDRPLNLPLNVKETQRNIHKRMFMTFLRMSTAKESEAHYFTPAAHADIIYQKYLFDVPKLIDLCILYGNSNKALLAKLVANVFKWQPQYKQDWSLAVRSFAKIFKKVSDEVLPVQKPMLLIEQPKILSPVELSDLILYMSDITSTLKAFLDVYPPATEALMHGEFVETLVAFYESVVPVLQTRWLEVCRDVSDASFVKARFRNFKKDSTWIVNSILRLYFDPSFIEAGESSQIPLDSFISAVTTVLTEKRPESHFDYIISSLEVPKMKEKKTAGRDAKLVSHVKELLPHLGDAFIELCLNEFGNSPETVVDRILEDNLPPHLRAMNQNPSTEDLKKTSSQPKTEDTAPPDESTATSVLDDRLNVYDDDEFDVFNKDVSVDMSRVHFGKRFDPTSSSAVLNDKTHLEETRETYQQYDVETSWTYEEPREWGGVSGDQYEFDQYSDEYDDTYDSHVVGAADNDSAEDLFSVRRLNDKGRYSRHYSQFPDLNESSEEQSSGASHMTRPPSNVTILKRPSNDSMPKSKPFNLSSRKPQSSKGQSSEVKPPVESERARQLKEKNKSKRGNHNRKAMADKKRSRGM